jgi:hypothetical protein
LNSSRTFKKLATVSVEKVNGPELEKIKIYLGPRLVKTRFASFILSQNSLFMKVQFVRWLLGFGARCSHDLPGGASAPCSDATAMPPISPSLLVRLHPPPPVPMRH